VPPPGGTLSLRSRRPRSALCETQRASAYRAVPASWRRAPKVNVSAMLARSGRRGTARSPPLHEVDADGEAGSGSEGDDAAASGHCGGKARRGQMAGPHARVALSLRYGDLA
jgi:hypothetical protein